MNNDLISREALKKALELTDYNDIYDLTMTERLIDNAPTVKSYTLDDLEKAKNNGYKWGRIDGKKERPQGEWIIHNDFDGWVECPFCHVGHTVFGKLPKFCENCGADMRGGVDNDKD